jgi:hypothetical protein
MRELFHLPTTRTYFSVNHLQVLSFFIFPLMFTYLFYEMGGVSPYWHLLILKKQYKKEPLTNVTYPWWHILFSTILWSMDNYIKFSFESFLAIGNLGIFITEKPIIPLNPYVYLSCWPWQPQVNKIWHVTSSIDIFIFFYSYKLLMVFLYPTNY